MQHSVSESNLAAIDISKHTKAYIDPYIGRQIHTNHVKILGYLSRILRFGAHKTLLILKKWVYEYNLF